jgi:tetratricopeptide (TPR) repeat protein
LEGSALEDVAIALFGMGRQARVQGHQSLAEDFLLEGVGLAQDGGLEGWATFGSIQLGWCAWDRGDYDTAESLGQDALETSQLRADAWNRADALHLLADIARMRGEPGRTAELITDARAAYEILGDRRRAAACLRDMASLARARQDLENAARLFSDARREFEELGDRHAAAMCLNGLGEVARFLGRLEVAESCYQRAYDTLRSIGARADAAIALLNLGQTALSAGELGKAQDSLLRAEALAGGRQQPYLTLGLHLNFALLGALQGFWDEARQHLKVALEQSDRHGISDPDYARPLEQLGSLFLELGEEERGRDLQARARMMWAALGRKV